MGRKEAWKSGSLVRCRVTEEWLSDVGCPMTDEREWKICENLREIILLKEIEIPIFTQ
jgi:hypothetical protein